MKFLPENLSYIYANLFYSKNNYLHYKPQLICSYKITSLQSMTAGDTYGNEK